MKVFLSWSGSRSHQIAEELYKWLPMVIQKVQPFLSSDIEKGTRWSADIAGELEQCTFGIACVTSDNKNAPWLLFEAGALSKSVSEGRLTPLLCGIEQTDIQKSPLSQFQMTKFEYKEVLKLLHDMNSILEDGQLNDKVLDNLFEALWPRLDTAISKIIESAPTPEVEQLVVEPDKIMGALEELLSSTRAMAQSLTRPDKLLPEGFLRDMLESQRTGFIFRAEADAMRADFEAKRQRAEVLIERAVMMIRRMPADNDATRHSAMRLRYVLGELMDVMSPRENRLRRNLLVADGEVDARGEATGGESPSGDAA